MMTVKCWLDEGKNNFDFLTENGFGLPIHDKNAPLISFHEQTNGVKATKCKGANMIMAFLATRKLSTEDKPYLRFTYIDTIIHGLSNKMELSSLISTHFNLIVLCPSADVRKAGNEGNVQVQELHCFCANDLL